LLKNVKPHRVIKKGFPIITLLTLTSGLTTPLDFNSLVRAWSLGAGWIVYAGAGILPQDRVFGQGKNPPIDKQVGESGNTLPAAPLGMAGK